MRVCLVAHLAFPALTGATGPGGGVEYQSALLARWLATRGHRVTLVTWDEGQPSGIDVHDVRVLPTCRQRDGLPGLRFFTPRWRSLLRALTTADADVYYQNGAEYVTGQVALWCRSHERPFVFSTASNSDCEAEPPLLPAWRERVLYRAGLARADRIVVQTRTQQDMMRTNFGRESTVLPMPCVEPEDPPASVEPSARRRLVWIGRLCHVKRPDRLLDAAERCPDLHFDVAGLADDSPFTAAVLARARSVPNVTIHGAVSRDRINALLREAWCLCCTSDIEGFPNTFLEAWSHGVPVLTTFDPDGLVAARGLGWVAPPDGFAEQLRASLDDGAGWEAAAGRARRYYRDHHTVASVMPRFESLFAELVRSPHA